MTLNMVIAASRAATANWTILLMAIRADGRAAEVGTGGAEKKQGDTNQFNKNKKINSRGTSLGTPADTRLYNVYTFHYEFMGKCHPRWCTGGGRQIIRKIYRLSFTFMTKKSLYFSLAGERQSITVVLHSLFLYPKHSSRAKVCSAAVGAAR